jgi:hypothetical protein
MTSASPDPSRRSGLAALHANRETPPEGPANRATEGAIQPDAMPTSP